jgi:prepilin-type processing-associated H-X9-DG protein
MLSTAPAPATGHTTRVKSRRSVASSRTRPRPGGFTAIDLLVVLFLITVFALVLLLVIPRGREQARRSACQKNLAQIGLALAIYDQTQRCLPTIGRPAPIYPLAQDASPGPLRTLVDTFGLADFRGLDPNAPLPRPTGPVPGEIPVPGFVCSSDPNAIAGVFRAPISYRGTTGDDQLGRNGIFTPGRRISLAEVQQGDGSSYTAAFSERLVGDNLEGHLAPWNYAAAIAPLPSQGCSLVWLENRMARWYGDAGSSWVLADYRSTLYNHALLPGAPLSCVAMDGLAAYMGASSGHVRGVNLLMLDGSVKLLSPSVNPKVWKEFAALSDPNVRRKVR